MQPFSIQLDQRQVIYYIVRKKTLRTLRVQIDDKGQCKVLCNFSVSIEKVVSILERNKKSILHGLDRFQLREKIVLPAQYAVLKPQAQLKIRERVEHFNSFYQQSFNGIVIRRAKSRWGSCSKTSLLSFNYTLVALPDELIDYVVVHELCHLIEFNHSPKFWEQVSRQIPDWRERRKALRNVIIKDAPAFSAS